MTRTEIETRAADFIQRRRFWNWNADDDAALDKFAEEIVPVSRPQRKRERTLAATERYMREVSWVMPTAVPKPL